MNIKTISIAIASAAALMCLAGPATAGNPQSAWLVEAEYLNWRTTRSSSPYSGTLAIGAGSSYVNQLLETEYDHDSGFRFAMGRQFANKMDIMFRFANFDNDGAHQVGDPTVDTNTIYANLIDRTLADNVLDRTFDDGHVDFAQEDINLQYSVYDLEFGKTFCRSTLSARPFGGIRLAQIQQNAQVCYQNFTPAAGANPAELDTYDLTSNVDMNSWGIRTGGQVDYALFNCGLSVFGRGAGSLMLADFRVRRLDVATDQPSGTVGSRDYQYGYTEIVPQLELAVGLRYERGSFFMAAGYELAYWFNMYQQLDIVGYDDVDGDTPPIRADRGSLGLDGFFVSAGVAF